MSADPRLLARLRELLANRDGVTERRMFGSVAFLVDGRMACGPHDDHLIVRIGEEAAARWIGRPHVSPMDFTGRVMRNFATIEAAGLRTQAQLERWVSMAVEFARSDTTPRPRSGPRLTRRGGTSSSR